MLIVARRKLPVLTQPEKRRPDLHGEGLRLLCDVLCRLGFADPAQEPEILKGENGRPCIPGASFDFNLSHSGDWVLCAVSDRRVGIDVQIHAAVRDSVLRRCYSTKERAAVAASSDPRRTFYDIWTGKEAFAKYTGEGLKRLLQAEDLSAAAEELDLKLIHIPPEEGYSAAVCTAYDSVDYTMEL